MKCRINTGDNGEIFLMREDGQRSETFDQLSQKVGTKKALDVMALAETEDFKNTQAFKKSEILNRNKKTIEEQAKNFADVIGASVTERPGVFKYTDGNSTYYFKSVGNNIIGDGLIETPKENRGKGFARALMTNFVKQAGANGLSVRMVVAPRDNSTTEKGLKSFYKSLGFSFQGSDFEMMRKPQKSDKSDETLILDTPVLLTIPVEPTVEEVVTFATKKENTLSIEDEIDLDNSLSNLGLSSYGELVNKIESGLLKDGILVFTENNLLRSGVYNKFETSYILNNIATQEEIRRIYQALKNSDNKIIGSVNRSYIITTGDINSFGKQMILNPYIVEQEVTRAIAGKDLDIYLDDIPYDSIKNLYNTNPAFKEELDRKAANNRNIQSKKIEFDELVDKTTNTNRELFEKTLDLDSKDTLVPIIDILMNVSNTVWEDSLDSVYTILKDFNTKAIGSGIDFLDLENKTLIKTQDEILDLLGAFSDVLSNPNDNNMDYFFDAYSEFFDIASDPVIETTVTKDDTNIYLETDLSEVSLFNDFGLVKESENVYKQIEKTQDVEEAYEILFTNKNRFPSTVESIEDLKEYVNSIIAQYNADSFEINLSDLENMIVHKLYFDSPLESERLQDGYDVQRFTDFQGDYTYFTKVFPSDFYKRYISEKRLNSDAFRDFYSNFTVNEKGIVLLNTDPITLSQMEPYIDQDLRMYNLVSKNLNLPVEVTDTVVDMDEMQYRREYAISNPGSVDKLKGDFITLSPETIAVRNETGNFVRTPTGIFEMDYQIGDVAFYNKLAQGNEYYNSYGQHKMKTESSIDVRDYGNLETMPEIFIKAKNFYNEKELEEINKKHFDC